MVVFPTKGSHCFFATLLSLLQIALSIAIAVVVSVELWTWKDSWNWSPSWLSETSTDKVCLMTPDGTNLCAYMYAVVTFNWSASISMLITQLFSRGHSRRWFTHYEVWFSLVLLCWWIAGATTATVYGVRADNASVPEHDARTAVWAMGWSEVGLWGLSTVLAFISRRSAERHMSETEMSATLSEGEKQYSRFGCGNRCGDAPIANRSSQWCETRDSYKQHAEAAAAAKV